MDAKYIIVASGGFEYAIVFDKILNHCDVGCRMHKVVSAGFCSVGSEGVSHWGKSESLGIESRPEDVESLKRVFEERY